VKNNKPIIIFAIIMIGIGITINIVDNLLIPIVNTDMAVSQVSNSDSNLQMLLLCQLLPTESR
jgi:hypothetical protein